MARGLRLGAKKRRGVGLGLLRPRDQVGDGHDARLPTRRTGGIRCLWSFFSPNTRVCARREERAARRGMERVDDGRHEPVVGDGSHWRLLSCFLPCPRAQARPALTRPSSNIDPIASSDTAGGWTRNDGGAVLCCAMLCYAVLFTLVLVTQAGFFVTWGGGLCPGNRWEVARDGRMMVFGRCLGEGHRLLVEGAWR